MSGPRRCKAVRPYVAKNDDELTFNEGDIIFVGVCDPGLDMWTGVFAGKMGKFPRIYVDDTTVVLTSTGAPRRAKSIHDYEAKNDDEVSFPVNATIYIGAEADANFWVGVYDGKEGKIPKSHVQDGENTDTLKRRKKTVSEKEPEEKKFEGMRGMAVKTHVGTEKTHLNFKVGDIVFIPKPDPELEMWQGVSNNEIGTFPKGHVVDTKDKSKEELAALKEAALSSTDEQEAASKIAAVSAQKEAALERVRAESQAARGSAAAAAKAAKLRKQMAESEPVSSFAPPSEAAEDAAVKVVTSEEKRPSVSAPADPAAPAASGGGAAAAAPEPVLTEKEKKALAKKQEAEAKEAAKAAKKAAETAAKAAAKEAKEAEKAAKKAAKK